MLFTLIVIMCFNLHTVLGIQAFYKKHPTNKANKTYLVVFHSVFHCCFTNFFSDQLDMAVFHFHKPTVSPLLLSRVCILFLHTFILPHFLFSKVEPDFLPSLCYSFFFSLQTCHALGCFFLGPSTPLPVTQYFQFTLLL